MFFFHASRPAKQLINNQNKKIVKGVKKNSSAFKAGLRDGMKYISIDNHNRFGAAWEKNLPIILKVSNNELIKEIMK